MTEQRTTLPILWSNGWRVFQEGPFWVFRLRRPFRERMSWMGLALLILGIVFAYVYEFADEPSSVGNTLARTLAPPLFRPTDPFAYVFLPWIVFAALGITLFLPAEIEYRIGASEIQRKRTHLGISRTETIRKGLIQVEVMYRLNERHERCV